MNLQPRTEPGRKSEGCVVVLEPTASWPLGVVGANVEQDGLVIVRVHPDESERALLARVMLGCTNARGGLTVDTAVLSCGEGGDEQRDGARTRLACGLLSQVMQSGRGRLVLVTEQRRGPSANSLLGLAGILLESLAGTGISVEVHVQRAGAMGHQPVLPTTEVARLSGLGIAKAHFRGPQEAALQSAR